MAPRRGGQSGGSVPHHLGQSRAREWEQAMPHQHQARGTIGGTNQDGSRGWRPAMVGTPPTLGGSSREGQSQGVLIGDRHHEVHKEYRHQVAGGPNENLPQQLHFQGHFHGSGHTGFQGNNSTMAASFKESLPDVSSNNPNKYFPHRLNIAGESSASNKTPGQAATLDYQHDDSGSGCGNPPGSTQSTGSTRRGGGGVRDEADTPSDASLANSGHLPSSSYQRMPPHHLPPPPPSDPTNPNKTHHLVNQSNPSRQAFDSRFSTGDARVGGPSGQKMQAPPATIPSAYSTAPLVHNHMQTLNGGRSSTLFPNLNPTMANSSGLNMPMSNQVMQSESMPTGYFIPHTMWPSQYLTIGDPMNRQNLDNPPNWNSHTFRPLYEGMAPYPVTAAEHMTGDPHGMDASLRTPSATPTTVGLPTTMDTFIGRSPQLEFQPAILGHPPSIPSAKSHFPDSTSTKPPQYLESKRGEDPSGVIVLERRVSNMSFMKLMESLAIRPLLWPRKLAEENYPANKGVDLAPDSEATSTDGSLARKRVYSMTTMYSLKENRAGFQYMSGLRDILQNSGASPDRSQRSGSPAQFQSRPFGTHSRRRSLGNQNAQTPSPLIKGSSPDHGSESMWKRSRNVTEVKRTGHAFPEPPVGTGSRLAATDISKIELIKRRVKNLLNKMTVERFAAIAEDIAGLLEATETEDELKTVVDQTYMKAVSEPDFSEMYTDLVLVLRARSPQFENPSGAGKPGNFQRGIVVRCQEEFNDIKNFSKFDLSEEQLAGMTEEDIGNERKKRKKLTLGNMRFIGQLFMRRVLSGMALKQILYSLVKADDTMGPTGGYPAPHLIECICELLTTIGYNLEMTSRDTLDTLCCTLDQYKLVGVFEKRIQYKIQDVLDLRGNQWTQKLVHKTKARALQDIRCDQSGEVEVVGLESDYPYKPFVHKWNEVWHQRRREEREKSSQTQTAALLTALPSAIATPKVEKKPETMLSPTAAPSSAPCASVDPTNEAEVDHNPLDVIQGKPESETKDLSVFRSRLLKSCRKALTTADKSILINAVCKSNAETDNDVMELTLRILGEDESDPQGRHLPEWISEAVQSLVLQNAHSMNSLENGLVVVCKSLGDFTCDKPTAPLCFARFFSNIIEHNEFHSILHRIGKAFADDHSVDPLWMALTSELSSKLGGLEQAKKQLQEIGLPIRM